MGSPLFDISRSSCISGNFSQYCDNDLQLIYNTLSIFIWLILFCFSIPLLRASWKVPKDSITPRRNQQIFYLLFATTAIIRILTSIFITLQSVQSDQKYTPEEITPVLIGVDILTTIVWSILFNCIFAHWSSLAHQISFRSFHVWWLRYKIIGWSTLLTAALIAYTALRFIWEIRLDNDSFLVLPIWLAFQILRGATLLIPGIVFITTIVKLKHMLLSTITQSTGSISNSVGGSVSSSSGLPQSSSNTSSLLTDLSASSISPHELDTYDSTADLGTLYNNQHSSTHAHNNTIHTTPDGTYAKRAIIRQLTLLLVQHLAVLSVCALSIVSNFLVIGPFVHLFSSIVMFTMLSKFQPEKILLEDVSAAANQQPGYEQPDEDAALAGSIAPSSSAYGTNTSAGPKSPSLLNAHDPRHPNAYLPGDMGVMTPSIHSTASTSRYSSPVVEGGRTPVTAATSPLGLPRAGAGVGGGLANGRGSGSSLTPSLGVGSSLVESYLAQSYTGLALSHESASVVPTALGGTFGDAGSNSFRFNQQQHHHQPSDTQGRSPAPTGGVNSTTGLLSSNRKSAAAVHRAYQQQGRQSISINDPQQQQQPFVLGRNDRSGQISAAGTTAQQQQQQLQRAHRSQQMNNPGAGQNITTGSSFYARQPTAGSRPSSPDIQQSASRSGLGGALAIASASGNIGNTLNAGNPSGLTRSGSSNRGLTASAVAAQGSSYQGAGSFVPGVSPQRSSNLPGFSSPNINPNKQSRHHQQQQQR